MFLPVHMRELDEKVGNLKDSIELFQAKEAEAPSGEEGLRIVANIRRQTNEDALDLIAHITNMVYALLRR
jgi:hypothetical protein